MKAIFIYAGTFSPVTSGHARIAQVLSKQFPHLHIVCGENPRKINDRWFQPNDCVNQWLSYDLPENVTVSTLADAPIERERFKDIILIIGIRNNDDFESVRKVRDLNRVLGITKCLLVECEPEFAKVSSTRARELANSLKLAELKELCSPQVVGALLEKVLGIRNLYLVVGKPASGKSTVMKKLAAKCPNAHYINSDEVISPAINEFAKKTFGSDNVLQLLVDNEDKLIEAIYRPWLELIGAELRKVPRGADVFLEVATALQPNKQVYRYLGGKIIYLGCGDEENHARIEGRGTEIHHQLVERIPGEAESTLIAKQDHLQLWTYDTTHPADVVANQIISAHGLYPNQT